MTHQGGSWERPLSNYYERYSPQGLLLRYARGRVNHFVPRQLFVLAASLLLGAIVSPMAGLIAFVLPVLGDGLDCLYLRRVPGLLQQDGMERRVRLVTTLTAVLHGITIIAGASTPFWVEGTGGKLADGHTEPLFTLGILIGAAINAALMLPYHKAASVARLLLFAMLPIVIFASELMEHPENLPSYNLHMAGLAVLYFSLIWFLSFIFSSFNATRGHLLSQALQSQELERANARLVAQQKESRRLALVAECANDSVMLLDRQGHIQWANEAFSQITGYSSEEAIGKLPGDLLNHPATSQEAISAIIEGRKTGEPFRVEILNRRKDGRDLWLETNQVPMRSETGGVETYIAVERDITSAKLHEQQLEQARLEAEEGARAKTEFLANMSHEIRTPMNGVIGMAQLLNDTPLTADQKLYTGTILGSAQTLLDLINDVLDLSKLDSGEMEISQADFDLRKCLGETLQLMTPQAQGKGLQLNLDFPGTAPVMVNGDDRKLRQILLNLVGNAIKFTEAGGVDVTVSVQQADGGGLAFAAAVQDTGIGIAEDMLGRVFERFAQADAAISRRFGGTGLGLTISRRLAGAMGGSIAVASEPGQGSCFTLHLPLSHAKGRKEVVAAHDSAPPVPADGLAGLRLLVAEDNQVNRLLLRKFVERTPVEICFATNGAEAVEKVTECDPHIILMDMSMPIMDGLEATRAIRAMRVEQPVVIALTANAFDSDRQACLDAGMDEFLSKPVNRAQLLAMLSEFYQPEDAAAAG